MTAPYYAKRIAEAIPQNQNESVVEIGPGSGALSVFLKERFPGFHLVEKDPDIVPLLKKKLGLEGRWTIHTEDIMSFDLSQLAPPLHVVGNLPYNIAALIIKKVLMAAPSVASVTFMVQREVAERIVAGPNSKTNGFLSVFCRFFGDPVILFHVPSGAFFPRPKVESSVFQLSLNQDRYTLLSRDAWESFFSLVTRGFTMRRKMLIKSLSWKSGNKTEYIKYWRQAGIDTRARPENLTVFDWIRLYKIAGDLC